MLFQSRGPHQYMFIEWFSNAWWGRRHIKINKCSCLTKTESLLRMTTSNPTICFCIIKSTNYCRKCCRVCPQRLNHQHLLFDSICCLVYCFHFCLLSQVQPKQRGQKYSSVKLYHSVKILSIILVFFIFHFPPPAHSEIQSPYNGLQPLHCFAPHSLPTTIS